MADFRLRIGFAKEGPALWLSHLEVVRSLERCVRRAGLPYAVSQGFNPHMKHSFSPALPVGTGSTGEFMDVELTDIINPETALAQLQAVQHDDLPLLSVQYVGREEPSLQTAYNYAVYEIAVSDPDTVVIPELLQRLRTRREIEVTKKNKLKTFELSRFVVASEPHPQKEDTFCLSLVSRPEGSLRPEIILDALGKPDLRITVEKITRVKLENRKLD